MSPENSREWRSILVAIEDKVAIFGEEGSENWRETFVGLRLIVIYQKALEWFGLASQGQRGYWVLFVN